MLVEFRVGNYRSFLEPQLLSLVAGRDTAHPDNLIRWGDTSLLRSVAVYGANASGKSNLLRAIAFMGWFVRNSATTINVADEIAVQPFRLDRCSRSEPSLFEMTLIVDGVRYQYGFTVSPQRVHDEWLVAYPKGYRQRWFERRLDRHTQQTQWTFRRPLSRKIGSLVSERTRPDGLTLVRGADLNVEEFVPVLRAIAQGFWTVNLDETTQEVMTQHGTGLIHGDAALRHQAVRLLQDADFGIRDLRMSKEVIPQSRISPELLEGMSEGLRRYLQRKETWRVRTIHSMAGSDESVEFPWEWESQGTQRLFAIVAFWLDALRQGKTVVVDELDASMHPTLTRNLIELFQSREANTKGAQLIFATHDTSLMDQSLFRRDQIWLVERDARQASRLYSLYDFADKPRKGEALEKRYLAGRYGAVPTLGPTFESLQLH